MLYSFDINESNNIGLTKEIKQMIRRQLIEFLISNPNENKVEKLAELNRIDKSLIDAVAYELLGNLLSGGKSKGQTPMGLIPEQLEMGIQVEYEHTPDVEIATKIALDHLAEHKYYYSALKDMEASFANNDFIQVSVNVDGNIQDTLH